MEWNVGFSTVPLKALSDQELTIYLFLKINYFQSWFPYQVTAHFYYAITMIELSELNIFPVI